MDLVTSDFVLTELNRLRAIEQATEKNRVILLDCWLNKTTIKEYWCQLVLANIKEK